MAAFEPGAYAREPTGGRYIHSGHDGLRRSTSSYSRMAAESRWSIAQRWTTRVCALEWRFVRWGQTELPPRAGLAAHMRGQRGKLVAGRVCDDIEPPLPRVATASK